MTQPTPDPEPGPNPDPEPAPSPAQEPSSRWARRIVGPFTVGHLAIAAAVLVAAAVLLVVLGTPLGNSDGSPAQVPGSGFYQVDDPTTGLSIGQVAPELEGDVDGRTVGLRDLDGGPLRLVDLRGEPVWLSFFATWCPPCQEETPILRDAWERYAPLGLRMVAVSVQETTPDDVADWARTYDLRYPVGFDGTSAVFHAYHGFGLPTHVFIDRDGIIRHVQYGPLDREQVASIVEPLLAADTSDTPDAASARPEAEKGPAAESGDPTATPLH